MKHSQMNTDCHPVRVVLSILKSDRMGVWYNTRISAFLQGYPVEEVPMAMVA